MGASREPPSSHPGGFSNGVKSRAELGRIIEVSSDRRPGRGQPRQPSPNHLRMGQKSDRREGVSRVTQVCPYLITPCPYFSVKGGSRTKDTYLDMGNWQQGYRSSIVGTYSPLFNQGSG